MSKSSHSRRSFLQGKAALRTLADKVQKIADEVADRLEVVAGPAAPLRTASRRAMACDFEVQYHLADDRLALPAAMEALDLIESLETQMTVYRETSEVIEINESAAELPVFVESGLFGLLQECDRLYHATGGAFDITSGPLSAAWGFHRRDGRLPEPAELSKARERVGFGAVQLDPSEETIQFNRTGIEINLNSIGKGYALDWAAELMANAGAGDFLWHGGRSSVLARGTNRTDPRSAWTVRLPDPMDPAKPLAEFHLRNRALATSGGGTQFFEHEGRRYGHVIDPRTGWPVEGVSTATAIAPTAAEADALSTAFFVMSLDEVEAYCEEHPGVGAAVVRYGQREDDGRFHTFGLSGEELSLPADG
ncbi:MAG: FAD:protein FMN transferase [Planctomycetota bacterium]